MKIEVLADDDAVARRAAEIIAAQARAGVAARGSFTLAVSGGRTPWVMLRLLAVEEVPWHAVHLFQVDERAAPAADAHRNLTHIEESLLSRIHLPPGRMHAMPVEDVDLAKAAGRYADTLCAICGSPPVLDLVHLGLGPDGHTASLVPDDPVLEVARAYVAATMVYQKRRRMTLTFPTLNNARSVLWVVTGAEKVAMLERLRSGDPSIPAGRVSQEQAVVLADRAAAGQPQP
jgi:6-phosphogluconolactonase